MTYDERVPSKLKKSQKWFASIITRPIDEDSRMNPISPSGVAMEEEACDFIAPSPTLRPAQRIQIYNQQYWWRLLNILQEAYPLVTRLFGYHDFNQSIAIPYLVKYPPNSWALNTLGDNLPKWVREDYHESDKTLVQDSIDLDTAFNLSFLTKNGTPVTMDKLPVKGDIASLLDVTLYLQPHVHLFEFNYDLFAFRVQFLNKDVDYWVHNDFPELPSDQKYFVLFRTLCSDISWQDVSQAQFLLLKQFEKGCSIEKACDWLENQDEKIFEEASQHLHVWIQDWIIRQWLSFDKL